MHKIKRTQLHNELKAIENELKMNRCKLTLHLTDFNESKLTFFSFFCGKIKFICELRHTFFINLRLRQI